MSLQSQFADAIDVVYIDPPYNRGGNDFATPTRGTRTPTPTLRRHYVSNEDGGGTRSG